jgi:hypothetical protein
MLNMLTILNGIFKDVPPNFIKTSFLALILIAKATTAKVRVTSEPYMFKISMIVT